MMLCTGMASIGTLRRAMERLGGLETVLMVGGPSHLVLHETIRVRYWQAVGQEFRLPLGSASPTVSFPATLAAVSMGASVVERPLTLSHSEWGANQALSAEPEELRRLVVGIRALEDARTPPNFSRGGTRFRGLPPRVAGPARPASRSLSRREDILLAPRFPPVHGRTVWGVARNTARSVVREAVHTTRTALTEGNPA